MLFADDSYIYCRATREEASKVMEMLKTFEAAAGKKINVEKSLVFFSKNTSTADKEAVLEELNMRLTDGGSLYLGLPGMVGRNKTAVLGFIKDKIRAKIRGWGGRCILGLGKKILIDQ